MCDCSLGWNTPKHTKKHMSTYILSFVVFRRSLVIIACKRAFIPHVACRQVPFHGIGRQVIKDSCKNNYKQSCEPGCIKNMKTCWLVGVGCVESLMQVTCNKKHFCPVTHFCFTCVKQIMVCV